MSNSQFVSTPGKPLENEAKHQEKYDLVLEQKNQDGSPELFTKSQWSDIERVVFLRNLALYRLPEHYSPQKEKALLHSRINSLEILLQRH